MNLGLSLIKPAESDLGIAMRLWLVNRATWKFSTVGWNQRIAEGIANDQKLKDLSLPKNTKGFKSVRYLQAHLLRQSAIGYLELAVHSYSRRNCPECARIGYHSVHFDYPWLSRCPVHNKALVGICPDCGTPWPSANNVHTRTCDCCGIRKQIENVIENGGFDIDKFKSRLSELTEFFNSKIECLEPKRSFNLFIQSGRNDQFSRTHSYPSVLASQISLNDSKLRSLNDLGLDLLACHSKLIEVEEKGKSQPQLNCFDDTKLKMAHRCRKRIFRLVNNVLEHYSNHTLGSCQRNEIYGYFDCVYCESWHQWNKGFELHIETNTNQSMFSYDLPFSRSVKVRDPGLVSSLFDYRSSIEYQVPERTQRLIYQIELWLCFRKMMSQIEFYLRRPFDLKESYASYSESDRAYLSHEHHHFGYFYLVKQADQINLIFPKAYVDSNLNNDEQLLSLFKEPT